MRSRRVRQGVAALAGLLLLGGGALAEESGAPECPGVDVVEETTTAPEPAPEKGPSVASVVGGALWNEAKRYGGDTAALLAAPFHWDANDRWKAAGSAVLIGGAFAADPAVYRAFARNRSDFTDSVSKATTWFGGRGGVYVAVGILGAGLLSGDADVRDMGRDAVEASIIAGAFTNLIIKPTAGRWRPSESDGATKFEPFSSHDSFSSGHATQAFAVASVVAMRSPGWILPTIAYGLATVVACDRINDRAHFASDVVAGALFATATGRFLVNRHRPVSVLEPEKKAVTFEVLPIQDGVALRARW